MLLLPALFICASTIFGQWQSIPNSPNGIVRFGENISYPNTGNEAIFAGDFSGRVTKFNLTTGAFTTVSGFETTDIIFGLFKRAGTWYVNGYFKRSNLHYLAMAIDLSTNTASPAFQTTGPTAPSARLEVVGYGLNDTLFFYGNILGTVGGASLNVAKVGKILPNNNATAIPQLRPNHSDGNPKIYSLGWDNANQRVVALGHFNSLGVTNPVSTTNVGVYDNVVTPVPGMPSQPNIYCRGFHTNHFGWNGDTSSLSDGGLKLSGTNMVNLSTGWEINPLTVKRKNNLFWFSGFKNGINGSTVATWDSISGEWTNREDNLFNMDADTNFIGGVVSFGNNTVIAFGNMTTNNSNFVGMAKKEVVTIPLPIKWLYFIARLVENNVILEWSTASEKDNAGFEVQRSTNGINWQTLGFVPGNGTTAVENEYIFNDEKPLPGVNNYRLKQIDLDGNFEHSMIISVTLPEMSDLTILPNPANDYIKIEFGGNSKNIVIEIFDASGNRRFRWEEKEAYVLNLDLGDLDSGTYLLRVHTDGKQKTQALVITRN